MTCRVCERTIRGNAAVEEYDESRQVYVYTCQRCARLFKIIERRARA